MRKIISLIIFIIIISTTCTYAEQCNFELVKKSETVYRERSKIDRSKFLLDDNWDNEMNWCRIKFGNGIYIQTGGKYCGVPYHKIPVGTTNSPLYIYDENVNLIKKVEFEDTMELDAFYRGYFYFFKTIYDGGETQRGFYKSPNGETFTEVPYYEYMTAISSGKLCNGVEYIRPGISDDDYNLGHTARYIRSSDHDTYLWRELDAIQSNRFDLSEYERSATDYKILVFTLRYWNGDNYEYTDYISLDGVTTFELPEYAASFVSEGTVIWNDDTYIYFENKDDEEYWYRAKVSDLTGRPIVVCNNVILSFETPPVTESDRTLVPMRFLFRRMGAEVEWDEKTQTATVTKDDDVISFTIDSKEAKVNDTVKTMDVPARLISNKTMIPLRFLSEELGYTVEWDEESKTATISE